MKKGFTLLELLVVIGIIGTIMALATVAYTSTQKAGRDSKRKRDLVAIQNALEQFYTVGNEYPSGSCATTETKSYLKSEWPTDPVNSGGYAYIGTDICEYSGYCICAKLETGKGGNTNLEALGNNAATPVCNFGSTGEKDYYCVANLQ